MKHWLAICMMGISVAAAAEPAMISDRGKAGRVVLTAEEHAACDGGQRIAYLTRLLDPDSRHRDTITYWGCWKLSQNIVQVHYFVGSDDRYRRGDFTLEEVPRIEIPRPGAPPGAGPSAPNADERAGQPIVWRP